MNGKHNASHSISDFLTQQPICNVQLITLLSTSKLCKYVITSLIEAPTCETEYDPCPSEVEAERLQYLSDVVNLGPQSLLRSWPSLQEFQRLGNRSLAPSSVQEYRGYQQLPWVMEEGLLYEVERGSGWSPFDLGDKIQLPTNFMKVRIRLAQTLVEVGGAVPTGAFYLLREGRFWIIWPTVKEANGSDNEIEILETLNDIYFYSIRT